MPLLLLNVCFDRANPRALPVDARAVPAEPYAHLDEEAGSPGGITRADIDLVDVRALGSFGDGAEVFVESDDPEDLLELGDDDPQQGRIWWRATVVER